MKYSGDQFSEGYAVEEPFFPDSFIIERRKHILER